MPILPKIFIAYAHEDKDLLKKLRTHLNVMKRNQHCEIFFDGIIMPGETWDKRLKDELHAAHIFVLLVTAEFLDSDYVNETELPKILERRSKGEAEVVAVILKDCLWEMTELQHLQVVLHDGYPVEERNAYAYAAREVFRVIESRNENLKQQAEAQRLAEEEAAARRLLDPFADLMVRIEGGSFDMGSNESDAEKPIHKVTVKDFSLCKYPVTQAAWKQIMGQDNNPSKFKGDDLPVENVSWQVAQTFIQKLNEDTGQKYRLPTEAEWEYAARGGEKSRGYQYAGSNDPKEVAWYDENADSKTHPVGLKTANELGLHDLSGNVWEWCEDVWHDSYKDAPADGSPWTSGGDQDRRVLRGGSWFMETSGLRSAFRGWYYADDWDDNYGFRVAQD